MDADVRTVVLEKLEELEGWAEYIVEALHLDQTTEPVTRTMIEGLVDRTTLRQLRELSWSLRDKLHVTVTQVELSHRAPIPEAITKR